MPTVFRERGWVGSFYSNENDEPPHIHVRKDGKEAKFWVGPVRLARQHGLKPRELADARALVEAHEDQIVEAWTEYFGD